MNNKDLREIMNMLYRIDNSLREMNSRGRYDWLATLGIIAGVIAGIILGVRLAR